MAGGGSQASRLDFQDGVPDSKQPPPPASPSPRHFLGLPSIFTNSTTIQVIERVAAVRVEFGGGWWCRCPGFKCYRHFCEHRNNPAHATNRLSSAQRPAAPSDVHVIDHYIVTVCREQGRQRLTVTPVAHQGVVLEGQPGQGMPSGFGCEGFLGLGHRFFLL